MSYATVARCANDHAFTDRLTAAYAQEGSDTPEVIALTMRWTISSASDIEAAYASALAAENPNPGGDETVITDAMILSAVQANPAPAP